VLYDKRGMPVLVIKYFASLRETLGLEQEKIDFVEGDSIRDIQLMLSSRSPDWSKNIMDSELIVSLNQEVVDLSELVSNGDEIAFFPPVTGG